MLLFCKALQVILNTLWQLSLGNASKIIKGSLIQHLKLKSEDILGTTSGTFSMKENQVLNFLLLKLLQLKINRYLATHFSINLPSKDKLLSYLNQRSQKRLGVVAYMEMEYLEYSVIVIKGIMLNQLLAFQSILHFLWTTNNLNSLSLILNL